MSIYEKLDKLGIKLPPAPVKGGVYSPTRLAGKLLYVSGCGCNLPGKIIQGKLGESINLEQGQQCARNAMLNTLAAVQTAVGDLNRIKSALKILVFVASSPDFYQQPQVADGASELLSILFGEENVPVRSAVGMAVLPGNMPVEVESVFLLQQ